MVWKENGSGYKSEIVRAGYPESGESTLLLEDAQWDDQISCRLPLDQKEDIKCNEPRYYMADHRC